MDSENRQSIDRHEKFLAEKVANEISRFTNSETPVFPLEDRFSSGSSLEWAKNNFDYSYELSLGLNVLENISTDKIKSLFAAVEMLWKNADRRSTFVKGYRIIFNIYWQKYFKFKF